MGNSLLFFYTQHNLSGFLDKVDYFFVIMKIKNPASSRIFNRKE